MRGRVVLQNDEWASAAMMRCSARAGGTAGVDGPGVAARAERGQGGAAEPT